MNSSPTRTRVPHPQTAQQPPQSPAQPPAQKLPAPTIAGACNFTQLDTIYCSHPRTLHIQTACFRRDRTLLAQGTPIPIADIVPLADAIYAELDDDQEHFIILTCDAADRIYGFKLIATGAVDTVEISHGAVLRAALLLGARAIILMHNHPSGNLYPSAHDLALTRRLRTLAGIHDLDIHDHIIYSPDTGALSLRALSPAIWPEDRHPSDT